MGLPRAIGRMLLVGVIVVLAVSAVGLAWAVWEYEHLTGDIGHAHARLPRVVSSALTQAGATADSPTVTMVRGYGGLAVGSTMLFRSDPTHHEFSFLTIPRALSHLPPSTRRDSSGPLVARLTAWVRRSTGVSVNHVALLNFAGIRGIVDALGGIQILNHTAFDLILGKGQVVHFPTGLLRLDGAQTVMFMSISPDSPAQRALGERNEAEVLQAVIDTASRPRDVSHLVTTAQAMAAYSETDLSTPDIVGLVAARLSATRIVNCHLARVTTFDTPAARSAVANFAGLTTTPSPDCVVRTATPGVSEAILGASARALSRYGVSTLVVVLLVVLTAMAGAIAVLAGRRVPFFPVRRTVVGGRDMVVDTWQTRRTRRSGMGRPRYLARVRYGLLERVDSLREAVRRSVPWRRQRRWPRQTGLSWRIGDFRNKASHADAYVRPSETASRSGERPVLSSQPSGPETASNTARSTLETESRATPVSAVSPEKQNGDQAEMVIRLRREGLSYREISERLTAERGEPVSAATTRRIWREATARY